MEKLPNEIEGLETTVTRLRGMVDTVAQYVNKVVVSLTAVSWLLSLTSRSSGLTND
jgi:archaellum component FlaC